MYWFSQLNSRSLWKLKDPTDKNKREVILYCGPSNKSVDVVAGKYLLKNLNLCAEICIYKCEFKTCVNRILAQVWREAEATTCV